jgi:hypothetical protein
MKLYPFLWRRVSLLSLAIILLTWLIQRSTVVTAGTVEQDQHSATSLEQNVFHYYFPFAPVAKMGVAYPGERTLIHGVNFMSSAESATDEQQYQNGLATGATWNRWPIYWYRVEPSCAGFDWSRHDTVVQADLNHRLQINAILMGTPGCYVSGLSQQVPDEQPGLYKTFAMSAPNRTAPLGLYAPVFADQTDVPGPGKTINAANPWARFVFTVVNRYKPGGVLAQANHWPPGMGITHWEMWNEPDMFFFWNSSVPDYARLLKVGYLAAKQADADAQVMFGGLANVTVAEAGIYDFLAQVLSLYDRDPLAVSYGYFFDIMATHSYSRAWDSWLYVWRADREIKSHGLDKSVWLNETGVPAWDDYPGPVWDPNSQFRATMDEQADYTIQALFYAAWAGADAIFHFQLYDGCGNQPAGTNPPPSSDGSICDATGNYNGLPCAGDANGFYRNPADAVCFRQHPQPETARPKLAAVQLLTTYLTDIVPLDRQRVGSADPITAPQEWISFYRPATHDRVMALWARYGSTQTAVVPAVNQAGTALLIAPDGTSRTIVASSGAYSITLPGATNLNTPWEPRTGYPIGGRPFLLVEPVSD